MTFQRYTLKRAKQAQSTDGIFLGKAEPLEDEDLPMTL